MEYKNSLTTVHTLLDGVQLGWSLVYFINPSGLVFYLLEMLTTPMILENRAQSLTAMVSFKAMGRRGRRVNS